MEPKIHFTKRNDSVRIAYSTFGEGVPLIYPAPWVSNIAFFIEDQTFKAF